MAIIRKNRLYPHGKGRLQEKVQAPLQSVIQEGGNCRGAAMNFLMVDGEGAPNTSEKVHLFIEENGSQRVGKHHEIYLSDIRRAAPGKWKTIVRQPMSS